MKIVIEVVVVAFANERDGELVAKINVVCHNGSDAIISFEFAHFLFVIQFGTEKYRNHGFANSLKNYVMIMIMIMITRICKMRMFIMLMLSHKTSVIAI